MPNLSQCLVRNKLQWNFNQNTKLFIHENTSENIVCQMAAILSRGDESRVGTLQDFEISYDRYYPGLSNIDNLCWERSHCGIVVTLCQHPVGPSSGRMFTKFPIVHFEITWWFFSLWALSKLITEMPHEHHDVSNYWHIPWFAQQLILAIHRSLASQRASNPENISMSWYVHETGLILGLCQANERWRYFVTTSIIGLAQT